MDQNQVESISYHLNSVTANFGDHRTSRTVTVTILRDHVCDWQVARTHFMKFDQISLIMEKTNEHTVRGEALCELANYRRID